ncbi:hypothetical protein YPPY58_2971, partial [Yersinia pestis PY-58]
MAIPRYRGHG